MPDRTWTQTTAIANKYSPGNRATVYHGDCLDLLRSIPNGCVQLVVTSPPYNVGKEYEARLCLSDYIAQQKAVITECVRVLAPHGHICWQVGNYVEKGAIIPLDAVLYPIFRDLDLKMRNRIVWHFQHGLHCRRRFSGRYETINWFTKSDNYFFNLDPVRVPQKYPGKRHFKGPNVGRLSCNPLGKNPSDVWEIPNVKSNHVEKTVHPCQFPVELVERLLLSMTRPDDSVLDPFLGVGTTIVAAVMHGRRGHGAEVVAEYVDIAKRRIRKAVAGTLKTRPMSRPIFDPKDAGKKQTTAPWRDKARQEQPELFRY